MRGPAGEPPGNQSPRLDHRLGQRLSATPAGLDELPD